MSFVLLPALIPDIPKVYDAYFAAFKGDPMGEIMLNILFPGGITEEFRKAHTAGTLSYWHTSGVQYTVKCVDTDSGEIVGMALADVYLHERSESERQKPVVSWLQGEEKERAEKVLYPLWEIREKLWGARRHIYCHVIAIDPRHQGRKAGAAILRWARDMCDQLRLPLYFEASPSTYKMYEKMGFETINETVMHKAELLGTKEDIQVPLMVRMPACAGGQTFMEWRANGYPAWPEKESRGVEVPNGQSAQAMSQSSMQSAQPTLLCRSTCSHHLSVAGAASTATVGVSTKAKNLQLITSTAESVKFACEKNKLKNLQILQSAGEPADLTREEKEFREKNLQIVTSTGEAVRFARQKNKAKKGNAAIEAVAAGKSKEGSGNDDQGKGKGKA
ncbi:hypothetical protein LOZ58_004539 [Ophidiomyces ophidiicola]|nr:hypothetical protein LOZ58_004539 [Ophidiomyces ophidiicola]